MEAVPDLAIKNDAAADACAEGDEHAAVRTRAHARNALCQPCDRRVIADENGLGNVLVELLHKRHVHPAEVGAERNIARAGVGYAGNTRADGLHVTQRVAALVDGVQHAVRHRFHLHVEGDIRAGDDAALAQNLAAFVHQTDLNARAANVNTNINHEKSLLYIVIVKIR